MPYISHEDRKHIEHGLQDYGCEADIEQIAHVLKTVPSGKTGGAFNYFVCRLFMNVFNPKGYTDISDALGHLVSAERELRRRVLNPYEDNAAIKNGDVPEFVEFYRDHVV